MLQKIWVSLSHHQLSLRWNDTAYGPINGIRAKVWVTRVSLQGRNCWGDHNLTPYNYSKNRLTRCDVKCYKRFERLFLVTNWVWGEMIQLKCMRCNVASVHMNTLANAKWEGSFLSLKRVRTYLLQAYTPNIRVISF